MIDPELQQYFIERSTDGKPFSRSERFIAYQRTKNIDSNTSFGTQLNLNEPHCEGIKLSIFPAVVNEELPRISIGEKNCLQPYLVAVLNISEMSFGSLSENAITALKMRSTKRKLLSQYR